MKQKIYDCPACYLRNASAQALLKVAAELKTQGYGIKLFDCYRPSPFQYRLWKIKPDSRYVMPPWKGSMHSRGAAVDMTLTDAQGKELDMGTEFDYFGEKAYQTYTNLPKEVLKNRALLRNTMVKHGFVITRTEWWHYHYGKGKYNLAAWTWKCNTSK